MNVITALHSNPRITRVRNNVDVVIRLHHRFPLTAHHLLQLLLFLLLQFFFNVVYQASPPLDSILYVENAFHIFGVLETAPRSIAVGTISAGCGFAEAITQQASHQGETSVLLTLGTKEK